MANRLETRLLRVATVIGAGVWLTRMLFSRMARDNAVAAMKAVDDATAANDENKAARQDVTG
ncbi:hypothetical protein PQR71_07005 [Paraburkholderia fungorum]|uniref:hypothetical protein n=1 Tax=Paraburkholderia fungorum TaxID=134537 RepID=UPI0038BCB392